MISVFCVTCYLFYIQTNLRFHSHISVVCQDSKFKSNFVLTENKAKRNFLPWLKMNSVNQSQFFNPLMEDHSSPRSSNSSFDESKFGLGFTSNLLSTLEKSRSRIDEFCRKSKEIIDVACQTNSALSLQEQHEIDELVSKLQTLKRQRGVPTTTTSTKSPSHDIVLRDATNTQVVSIPNQRVVLKERQKVLEKELAHVYTSNKQKLRILQGKPSSITFSPHLYISRRFNNAHMDVFIASIG